MSDVFLARQPILDAKQSVEGYELLYRHADVERAHVDDQELATATVVLNALTEIGLERVVGEQRAWINVTREFVLLGLVHSLPPELVVLELLEDQLIDELLLERFAELRAAGYVLALDDFTFTPGLKRLVGLVDIVKLDLLALGRDAFAREADKLRSSGLTVVAEKIETHDDFQAALAAGCDLFQGYFFCRPQLLKGRAVSPNRLAVLQLAAALQDPTIELAELEHLISHDVALSYRLLRYINSAYVGLRQQVSSIRQAVVLLGGENVARWATLTILAEIGDKPRELFITALIRARFCQQAGEPDDGLPGERFTLGLFSVLDALTDTPMRAAVQHLPFPCHLREALIAHTGAGRLLDCIHAIEHGDFQMAHKLRPYAPRHYTDALAWAIDTAKPLFA
jgi:EAL and modified HD-GYP domain-containing signal transduction protein